MHHVKKEPSIVYFDCSRLSGFLIRSLSLWKNLRRRKCPRWQNCFIENYSIGANGDGRAEQIEINKYQNGERYDFYLLIKKPFYGYETQRLSGFEEEIDFCENPTVGIGNNMSLLCLTGYVGVHSQNIQLIGYDSSIKIIPFRKNDKALLSVYSDAPKFEISDQDSNQPAKVCLMNRNYDLDPLVDTTQDCYYFSEERFIYQED